MFGRAEKAAPSSASTVIIDGEELDMEYVKYCIEQDRTVTALESSLHECDDPKEIAEGALQAACLFYGGDWAGILDVDLDLDVWTPIWWYNSSARDKTTALFGEFELAKYMPNWINALKIGAPVLITDVTPFSAINQRNMQFTSVLTSISFTPTCGYFCFIEDIHLTGQSLQFLRGAAKMPGIHNGNFLVESMDLLLHLFLLQFHLLLLLLKLLMQLLHFLLVLLHLEHHSSQIFVSAQ